MILSRIIEDVCIAIKNFLFRIGVCVVQGVEGNATTEVLYILEDN